MISPLDILTSSQISTAPVCVCVDADTFAKLCARPGAQRYIVNGSINADGTIKGDKAVIGVHLDGTDYTVN